MEVAFHSAAISNRKKAPAAGVFFVRPNPGIHDLSSCSVHG